jgi:hypothetical protein
MGEDEGEIRMTKALVTAIAGAIAVVALAGPAAATATAATKTGAATATGAAQATANWTSDWFQSPTGNIRCRYFYGSNPLIACMTLNDGAMAGVRLWGAGFTRYGHGKRAFPPGPTLRYGSTWRSRGEFKCRSSRNGMDCWSLPSGHGFFISRDTWDSY